MRSAHSTSAIIFGKVATGIGGGGSHSISAAVGNDLIPLRAKGMVQGFEIRKEGAVNGLGGVTDGTLGGQWAFLVLVPSLCSQLWDTGSRYPTSESCCFVSKREDMSRCQYG